MFYSCPSSASEFSIFIIFIWIKINLKKQKLCKETNDPSWDVSLSAAAARTLIKAEDEDEEEEEDV